MIEFINSDTLRWFNVAASSLIVVLLISGTMFRWEVMPLRIRRVIPWVVMTYAVIAYGSAEIAWSDESVPQGYRVLLLMINLCGLLVALLYGFSDDDYDQP